MEASAAGRMHQVIRQAELLGAMMVRQHDSREFVLSEPRFVMLVVSFVVRHKLSRGMVRLQRLADLFEVPEALTPFHQE
jgi:hypothetical protein